MAVGQAKADVRRAAGRIHAQLFAQATDQAEHVLARRVDRADRHDQRVDHHILRLDPVILRALDDQLGDLEAFVRVFGNARLVVRNGDHGGIVLLHQRQHALHNLALGSGGVDQCTALVNRKPRFQRFDDRAVDTQRHVGDRLHQLDRLGEDLRLVRQRDAGIDVEHLRARLDLRQGIGLDARVIAFLHLGSKQLAPGRIDALADHDEGLVEADHDFLGGGTEYGS